MSEHRMMREGLRHDWSWSSDDSKFFALIDATGGWPVGYTHVGFEHTESRLAGFCKDSRNSGWWTVIANADDYYTWKLSPEALQRIVDASVAASKMTTPKASSVRIVNSRGYRAVVAATKGEKT